MKRREFVQGTTAFGLSSALSPLGCATTASPSNVAAAASSATPVLDAHMHLLSAALVRRFSQTKQKELPPADGDRATGTLQQTGIERGIALSGAYFAGTDIDAYGQFANLEAEYAFVRQENDWAAAQVVAHAGRLHYFMSVNPKRPYACDEINRCVEVHRPAGVKLHFWNSMVDLRHAAQLRVVKKVFALAERRNLAVLLHVFCGDLEGGFLPEDAERAVRELVLPFPQLRVCFAHLGGAGKFEVPAQRAFARLVDWVPDGSPHAHRVFADLAAVLFTQGHHRFPATSQASRNVMAELLKRWGPQRVLYGSDNVSNYLAHCRAAWPLPPRVWNQVAAQSGAGFLTSSQDAHG